MFKVIKQKLINGLVIDYLTLFVGTESQAKQIVKYFRQKENNQLCYYQEIK